jgi:tetratricopeptide (TPR) repeat protein
VYTLWLLFYNIPGLEDDFISDTSDLERRPMIELARSHVRGMIDAQHERKAVLGQIFELCLASEPEHRSTMDAILPLFQSVLYVVISCMVMSWANKLRRLVQVLEHNIVYPKTEARHQSAARFQVQPYPDAYQRMLIMFYQVALAMPQLFEIDFRVRTQIFQCLERLADETRRDDELSVYEEACLQLAFCYKMGFGVERADAKADMFLSQSHKNHVLEDQLIALKRSTNQGYNPSAVFGFWYAGGHMCTTTDAQYYREQKLLASVQAVHEREITDWAAVLGTVHWIVIAAASHYQVILENLGLLDKAEELARNVFTEVSRTLPENDIVVRGRKYTLARALYVQGKLEMVEKLVKEAVDGQRSSSDENDFAKLLQMNFLACLYATQGKLRKAAALMETLVRSFSSTFGDRHVHTLVITWNLCEIFRQQRRIKEAIVLSESLLQAATAVLGEEHELSILAKMSLTRLRWESRAWLGGYIGPRDDDTLRLDYIKSSQTLLGNDHPWTLDLMVSTVRNLIAKARFPEAIALQEQIITLSEKRPGPNHPRTIEHRGRMKYIKTMYSSYRFFERIGSLNIGQYVLTPGFRVREGLERICWPLYKKKDITNLVETPFKIDLSIGLNQG